MNPIDLDKDTIRLLAQLMDDESFEQYIFYYSEEMDEEIEELLRKG